MELMRRDFRVMIYYDYKKFMSAEEFFFGKFLGSFLPDPQSEIVSVNFEKDVSLRKMNLV